jgi:hypothetical protein
LGGDQAPLLPPGASLNLNQGSYQSDQQCSPRLASSYTSLGSVVHLRPSPWLAGRMNPPLHQAVHWCLMGSPPDGLGGCTPVKREVITQQSQIMSPQEMLREFASWDTELLRQLAGCNVLLCQHRLSRLMSKGWALRTKGSHLIYPCKQVTEAKSKV